MQNTKNNLKGSLILCLTALIWGLAFVAQTDAAEKVPPFMFNCLRSLVGSAVLYIFIKARAGKTREKIIPANKTERKTVFAGAAVCGTMLAVSINLQQGGISVYPDGVAASARAGFLTALYVILVPIISVFFGKKIHPVIWASVLTALAGVYLLCFTGDVGRIYLGDVLMLLCALAFSFHIITVDKYAGAVGGVRLSCLQFLFCGILSGAAALIFEFKTITAAGLYAALPQLLYLGIVSSGVGYTLQIIGQKYAEPSVASISMSLESVFAALGGWIIMGNSMSFKEISGCVVMFAAIVLAQTPEMIKSKREK